MKQPNRKLCALEAQLARLAGNLGSTRFISQGSVFERRKRGSGSRYQWTWKDPDQKTVSLTLSAEQFAWLKRAIRQSRSVEKTLAQMRQISRRVLLEHIPGPRRRKRLPPRRLRTI